MLGFYINSEEFVRPSAQLLEQYKNLPVANISDVMWRMAAGGAQLRPMHSGKPMVGPAFTVKARPGDNLMVHKALELAKAGDIIVVDAGGDLTNAIIGEIMVAYAIKRQLGGIVINGAIRDVDAIGAGDFPVFAAGVTHRGPYKDGPGEINTAIAIDGMVIHPGDIVVGDADGFLAIPLAQAEEVLALTLAKQDAEVKMMSDIANDCYDTTWVDQRLAAQGYKA